MAGAVHLPVFGPHAAVGAVMDGPGEALATGRGALLHRRADERVTQRSGNHLIAIARMNRAVLVTVEHDGRNGRRRRRRHRLRAHPDWPAARTRARGPAAHHDQRLGHVGGRSDRQAGVNPRGGEHLRVGGGGDGGHCPARRQPGDVDAPGVDAVLRNHRLRQAGQQRRLAAAAPLMVGLEPVPAALRVRTVRLRRVQHEQALRRSAFVHAGTSGKVIRVLRATMQHHHQRQRLAGGTGRHIQLVVARQARMRVRARGERGGVDLRCRARCIGRCEVGCGERRRRVCRCQARRPRVDLEHAAVENLGGRPRVRGRWRCIGARCCSGSAAAQRAPDRRGGFAEPAGSGQPGGFANHVLQGFVHVVPGSGRKGCGWRSEWGQRCRLASAAFTAGLACKAPSTSSEAMVASASSGVTSAAIVARPSTRMCSVCFAAFSARRSSAL